MGAEDDVETAGGEINGCDIELPVRSSGNSVGAEVLTGERLKQAAQCGFRGEVQDASAVDFPAIAGQPERHETMPFVAATFRAASIEAGRHTMRAEVSPVATERTFAREPTVEPIENTHKIGPFWGPDDGAWPRLLWTPSAAPGKQGSHGQAEEDLVPPSAQSAYHPH
jgi:hypothetical protein